MSIFSKVEKTRVKSNTFNLTHDRKLTCQFGEIIPCMAQEVIPGDKWSIKGNAMVRLAPMVAPVMHRANIYMHYFFVPNRILWDNWESFITGGVDGNDTSVHPRIPYIADDFVPGQLPDYFNIPTGDDVTSVNAVNINALPFAAYQKIFDDYFKDQNFNTDTIQTKVVDGDNTALALTAKRTRAWRHDYFTSALPWTQRGPEALLPLGQTAPLLPIEDANGDVLQFMKAQDGSNVNGWDDVMQDTLTGQIQYGLHQNPPGAGTNLGYVAVEDSHEVDLTSATASSINDLRRAFRLQEFLEKNARGGSRYIEQMQAHFGVQSSDKRLQRAEYIGGVQGPIKFSEVLQTSGTSQSATPYTDTPQGNMAGHGIGVMGSTNMKYYAEEHGWVIGVLSALPDTAYQQGIPKQMYKIDKFDYAFPSFAHIGEQPILNQEVYLQSNPGNNQNTWGYVPRYSEYKFANNTVHGDFRTSLDFWHMGRKFDSLPALNNDFIEMDWTEVERIFAVEGLLNAPLWIQVLNEVKVSRKLPIFGTPYI